MKHSASRMKAGCLSLNPASSLATTADKHARTRLGRSPRPYGPASYLSRARASPLLASSPGPVINTSSIRFARRSPTGSLVDHI